MKNFLKKIKKIIISLNNEEQYLEIDLDPSTRRLIFLDNLNDSTFIEIKENEFDENKIKFLEVDERMNKIEESSNQIESLQNESIYVLNYPRNKIIVNSLGKLVAFNQREEIIFNCSTEFGSSGSPILSLKTFKVIGFHSQGDKDKNKQTKKDYLIYKPINEFIKKYI